MPTPEISALLTEGRVFPPPDEWRASARANDPTVYARAAADPERFWAAFAAELDWMQPWTRVLDWQPP
ncbi:MAG TPA: acetyl-coenzyme A synthetase N-terminal domain-containing protein, partial [Vicinamibacterales bacterium]